MVSLQSLAYFAYQVATSSVFFLLLPYLILYSRLNGRYRRGLEQRLGRYPAFLKPSDVMAPRIWMHAASVGEVGVAAAIAMEIQNQRSCTIIQSATTVAGRALSERKIPFAAAWIYAPVDFPVPVRKALSFFKPDVLVCVETEIWPNWLRQARQMGIRTALVNGRISTRSLKRYMKITALTRAALNGVGVFSMISDQDAERIAQLGAREDRIIVNGNAKYDAMIRNHPAADLDTIRRTYSLSGEEIIIVAGSTRQKEEAAVFEAYRKIRVRFPEALLFLAPRHIERGPEIAAMAKNQGFDFQMRSGFDGIEVKRTSSVVIMDTIGELSAVYGVGTIAFCGGSLVPLGGQNILEAAVWGIPVFYGPHMEDFQEARTLLENQVGEAFLVKNASELAVKALQCLEDARLRESLGLKAKQAVLGNQGAAARHAREIIKLLPPG
jgi:3-deoxy-D-manno-octulosonic-acid transferase